MNRADLLEVLNTLPFDTRIRVQCFYKDRPIEKSGIMKVKNISFKHLKHWTHKKHLYTMRSTVDNKGNPLLIFTLHDDDFRWI